MQNESICIICFGNENLKKNKLCYNKCNFFYHETCYTNWQKSVAQTNATCIVCKDPVLNFITGEVSLINPLIRHNDIEFNNNTNEPTTYESEDEDERVGQTVSCIKKLLIMLIITMLALVIATCFLTLL